MKTKQRSSVKLNSRRLVIEESKSVFLGKGITISVVIGILLYSIITQYPPALSLLPSRFWGFYMLISAFIGLALYYFWKAMNPGVVAVLNEEGIWIKKQGLVTWEDITDYSSRYQYNKYWPVSEIYLLTKYSKKITVDLSLTETSIEVVEWHLRRQKGSNNQLKTGK